MNAAELTQKHLEERIDLEAMHKSELENMLKRHRLNAIEETGKYFERKRQKQMQHLLESQKLEKSRLFDTHEKEWEELRKVKQIIREARQLSFDLQPKQEPQQQKIQEAEEKNVLKKILKKIKSRSQQP